MEKNTYNSHYVQKTVQNVHINPKFANNPYMQINRNFPFTNGGLHINPNFNTRDVFDALSKEHSLHTTAYSEPDCNAATQRVIHVNPKVINITQTPTVYKPILQLSKSSKYSLHSKNKIIRNPSSSANVTKANISPVVPKKPSYSLVRNKIQLNKEPVQNVKQNPISENSAYSLKSESLINNLSNNKIWKKSSNIIRMKNCYKLCNRSNENKNTKPLNVYKLCNSNNIQKSKLARSLSVSSIKISGLSKPQSNFCFIGGVKYVVSDKILKRVQLPSAKLDSAQYSKTVKMVNVKGVTYIRKTDNLFIIDNRKQNSVAKRRKMNVTCPTFRRLGVCSKNNKGKCPLVHNPKYVSICQKFLKGLCIIDGCTLSHEVILEKMPACKFFLEGCCIRDLCPYLHVKISDSAKICHEFVQGYCANAKNCENLHMYVCPDFYKYSKCNKTKCPYPHKNCDRREAAIPHSTKCNNYNNMHRKQEMLPPESGNDQSSMRYFEEEVADKVLPLQEVNKSTVVEEPCNTVLVPFKNRPRLGTLPSYIALE